VRCVVRREGSMQRQGSALTSVIAAGLNTRASLHPWLATSAARMPRRRNASAQSSREARISTHGCGDWCICPLVEGCATLHSHDKFFPRGRSRRVPDLRAFNLHVMSGSIAVDVVLPLAEAGRDRGGGAALGHSYHSLLANDSCCGMAVLAFLAARIVGRRMRLPVHA